jgi:hypothetical protein
LATTFPIARSHPKRELAWQPIARPPKSLRQLAQKLALLDGAAHARKQLGQQADVVLVLFFRFVGQPVPGDQIR